MYFDTHAHLSDAQFDEDRELVISQAKSNGVDRIVEIADSPADWEKAAALAAAHPGAVFCSLGLHPYYADQWKPELANALLKSSAGAVAVGEIGLDYAKCEIPKEVQRTALLGMLAAAEAVNLPVVLHCREAYPDMLPLLEEFYEGKNLKSRFRGVMHCFSGTKEEALRTVKLGFALGVDGPVTYPKNNALREALKEAGLANLVLETDSPYLPPQSSRGKRNNPTAIPEIARALAAVFDTDVKELSQKTTQNAEDLFRLRK